jgi:Fic family protein
MTLISKLISGNEYLYYQDNVKNGGKNKVISTFIGRKNLGGQELINAKGKALLKHMVDVYRAASLIQKAPYHSVRSKIDNDELEFIKFLNQVAVKSLSINQVQEFEQEIFVRYVHGTTSIEGNSLSLGETESILIDDLTPQNKPVNEVIEIHNYIMAKAFLDGYKGDINTKLIKKVHKIIMNNILENGKPIETGKFRTAIRGIRGVKHSKPEDIESHVEELNEWYEMSINSNLHPIEIASVYHHRFEQIHPFFDGNGRVGRAILDFILKRHGFPTIYITKKERSTYLNALSEGDYGNHEPIISFILGRIKWTFIKLFLKTDIYKLMQTDKFAEFARAITDDDVMKKTLEALKEIEEDED